MQESLEKQDYQQILEISNNELIDFILKRKAKNNTTRDSKLNRITFKQLSWKKHNMQLINAC